VKGFYSYDLDDNVGFEFSGDHDIGTVPTIEPSITAAMNGQPRVIFDLSVARYIDSTVLNMLLRKHKVLAERMRVVVPASSSVRRIFAISGLDQYFVMAETVSEAAAHRETPVAA
jgi:anti-anti-sigma factor